MGCQPSSWLPKSWQGFHFNSSIFCSSQWGHFSGDAWNSFQADFASGVNNLVGTDMLSTSDIASKGLLDSLKGELT
jgi:hypothetical protein